MIIFFLILFKYYIIFYVNIYHTRQTIQTKNIFIKIILKYEKVYERNMKHPRMTILVGLPNLTYQLSKVVNTTRWVYKKMIKVRLVIKQSKMKL